MSKHKKDNLTVFSGIKFFLIILLIFIWLAGCAKKYNDKLPQTETEKKTGPADTSGDDRDNVFSEISPGNKNSVDDTADNPNDNSVESGNMQHRPVYINQEGSTLDTRILPPKGYTRVQSSSDELAGFIRSLPLKQDGSKVLKYDGKPIGIQDNHVAVFDMDIGKKDLQQCADSVMRIYGEYYWSIEKYDKIAFHLTNGFFMEYTKWRDGNRIRVNGNDVSWVKTASYDDTYENFRKYLDMVFAYAGTLSLEAESKPVSLDDLLPGDLLLEGGSPGHCVMIVDMAVSEDGSRCYLLAQGFMPAQDFHVLKNPLHPEDPWYYDYEMDFPIKTPSWTFKEGSLKRWADFELKEWSKNTIGAENKSSITLLAVGDNLIHIEVVQSGMQSDGTYNYDHLYDEMKDEIMGADIAVVNQETILGGKELIYSGYPAFNSPTEIGDALVGAGFDVILHATNHTMDKGAKGVLNTLEFWDKYPEITVLGINKSREDRDKIPVIEKNGIKIAMLNYTYGLNGYKLPADMPYLVNLLNKEEMEKDIKQARQEADFVIVFPHWGTEYVYEPVQAQKDLVEFFYNLKVDLVIGTHPHVLQPVEWIDSDPDHRMLVFYSLGNFLSYQKEAPRMLGGMAYITITKDLSNTYISNAKITPIVTHYEHGPSDYNYGIYKLSEYTAEMGRKHGVSDIAKQGKFTYEETVSLAKNVLKEWYEN
ncbi:MAG TPA: DUF4846 domain-containing protein [Mobilitalea sp.]|nr:DUF4846 domain-containing protein [Mobilitalea sp.]